MKITNKQINFNHSYVCPAFCIHIRKMDNRMYKALYIGQLH